MYSIWVKISCNNGRNIALENQTNGKGLSLVLWFLSFLGKWRSIFLVSNLLVSTMAAPAPKNPKEILQGEDFDVIFPSEGILNKFYVTFLGKFCKLLGAWGTIPPFPSWWRHYLSSISVTNDNETKMFD